MSTNMSVPCVVYTTRKWTNGWSWHVSTLCTAQTTYSSEWWEAHKAKGCVPDAVRCHRRRWRHSAEWVECEYEWTTVYTTYYTIRFSCKAQARYITWPAEKGPAKKVREASVHLYCKTNDVLARVHAHNQLHRYTASSGSDVDDYDDTSTSMRVVGISIGWLRRGLDVLRGENVHIWGTYVRLCACVGFSFHMSTFWHKGCVMTLVFRTNTRVVTHRR